MAYEIFTTARVKPEASRGAGGTPTKILNFNTANHSQEVSIVRTPTLGSYFAFRTAPSTGTEVNRFEFEGNLDFSLAPYWFDLFVKGSVSPSGSTPWRYSYTPTGTADDVRSWVVEFGDLTAISATVPGVRVPYVMGDEFSLTFAKSPTEPGVTYRASLIAAGTATQISAFTGSPTSGTAAFVATNATQFYADSTTIGSTTDDNVTEVEWNLQLQPVALYTLNNSAAAEGIHRSNARLWTATITRYFANDTEWDAYLAATERKIRVLATGPAYGSATYKLQLDLYGHYTARERVVTDGLIMGRFTLEPYYDTTATTDFALEVWSDTSSVA